MKQDERVPFDQALERARMSAYAPGEFVGQESFMLASEILSLAVRAGIGPGVRVVAYDDASGSVAARLWYLLRAHGHDDVAVLDGGIAKWVAEGRPVATAGPSVEPAVFTGRLRPACRAARPTGRAGSTPTGRIGSRSRWWRAPTTRRCSRGCARPASTTATRGSRSRWSAR